MIDLRNIYTPDEMAQAGFEYHSVGQAAAACRIAPTRRVKAHLLLSAAENST